MHDLESYIAFINFMKVYDSIRGPLYQVMTELVILVKIAIKRIVNRESKGFLIKNGKRGFPIYSVDSEKLLDKVA